MPYAAMEMTCLPIAENLTVLVRQTSFGEEAGAPAPSTSSFHKVSAQPLITCIRSMHDRNASTFHLPSLLPNLLLLGRETCVRCRPIGEQQYRLSSSQEQVHHDASRFRRLDVGCRIDGGLWSGIQWDSAQ